MYSTHHIKGLTIEKVKENTLLYGKNNLPENSKETLFVIFLKQFLSPFIYILLSVALLSLLIGELKDALVVVILLVANAIIGTFQEHRANNAMHALKKLSHTKSKVIRDGKLEQIKTEDITVDDIVFIESGDLVPADGELIESHSLTVNESQITGESLPVAKEKSAGVSRGSVVVSGNGFLLVKKIGKETMIGAIAYDIEKNEGRKSELEKKLETFSFYLLTLLAFVIVVFLIFSTTFGGLHYLTAIKTSIALGVAVIPEGLPVVLTVVLSLGALHISRAKALLRNLPSGSTLASVSFICTDKTGTLTHGSLTVKEIINISPEKIKDELWKQYLYHSVDIKDISGEKVGDVLELALEDYLKLDFIYKETKEEPFTSETKYNAKEYEIDGSFIQIYKGAPEALGLSLEAILPYVKKGYRVLFVGYKKSKHTSEFSAKGLSPLAIIIFEDKIRDEAKQSIADCKRAGIELLMITGDNLQTAEYVAKEVGIMTTGTISILGETLNTMDDEELKSKIKTIKVIARANPVHKERIVKILQELGEIVAMTGDGVNDGPALSLANIGISMGKSGTEVARAASDIILMNDDFSDIILAIFEARTISENIRKTLIFLMTSSLSIVVAILGSLLTSLPLPFLATQILWLNFVTAGLLDVAIATEDGEPVYRQYNFKRYSGFLLNLFDLLKIITLGTFMGVVTLYGFYLFTTTYSLETARTGAILLISAFAWFNALCVRKNYDTIFCLNIFSNTFILAAIGIEMTFLLLSIYLKVGNTLLQSEPLPHTLVFQIIATAVSIIFIDALFKKIGSMKFARLKAYIRIWK